MTKQWPRTRLKNIIEPVQNGTWGTDPTGGEDDILCVRVADFDRQRFGLKSVATLRSVPARDRAVRMLRSGDILLEKSGGTDANPVGFTVMFDGDYPAVTSNFIGRIRMREGQHPKYWLYALAASYLTRRTQKCVRQTTGIQNLDQAAYLEETFPVPPVVEQGAIADYLDHETAQINTLIAKQEQLIATLRERRHALVEGAFGARSLNSRLQYACIDIVDCPHTTPDVTEDGEYEAVRTASVRDGKYRPNRGLPVSKETWANRNTGGAPALGDVLFTREAPAGEACLVPNDRICLGQRMVLLRVNHEVCVGAFLLWQIYTDRAQDHFRLSANGSTVSNVRLPVLRTTPIWLPGLDEQRAIATHLDQQTAKIDTLITKAERFIELSKERRAALITAAVTGQVDVRAAVR